RPQRLSARDVHGQARGAAGAGTLPGRHQDIESRHPAAPGGGGAAGGRVATNQAAPMTPGQSVDGVLVQWGERLFYPASRIVKLDATPRLGTLKRPSAAMIRQR